MNFEEYWKTILDHKKSTHPAMDSVVKKIAHNAWEDCKKQVLLILAKAPRNNPNLLSTLDCDQQFNVEKEIKKL